MEIPSELSVMCGEAERKSSLIYMEPHDKSVCQALRVLFYDKIRGRGANAPGLTGRDACRGARKGRGKRGASAADSVSPVTDL